MGHMFGDSLEKKARLHAIATFVVGFWILSVANNMLQVDGRNAWLIVTVREASERRNANWECRGKRGRAIELSKDHKPNCTLERLRIEKLGGVIYDGYLNGQLSVARALGDWHIKGSKGSKSPLSVEPELEEIVLTKEDELISTMKV
ncbi:probable protein phosphatase 2C 47 [Arachis duranensis]|uniref:Probable protein phosphatase 2C 47 n=1 Tax=Arachis duranensis TaxID=130453 RepID=A0A6P4CL87_ARADU|nr:probable protein phosphatase 2C 47 [Arachis duranensis]